MFKIQSISAGWILGQLSDGNNTHYFNYSYITNFLDDFMLALLTVGGAWPEDEGRHKFRTELEPAIERWTVSKEQDELRIHIETYKDSQSKSAHDEITLTCNYIMFLNSFLAELERVLESFGLVGYRENWTYEFPVSLYLKLKDIAGGKDKLDYKTLSSEDNCGTEVQVSDYDKEIELL